MPAARTELRLAELIASISLATDLGMGQPMEQALRTCLIALALGRRRGCSGQTLADIYYLALVEHIACTADSYETSLYVGGDEMVFRKAATTLPFGPRSQMMPFMLQHFAEDRPTLERLGLIVTMMAHASKRFPGMTAARCEVGPIFAERLGLSAGVRLGITEALERWDGKGAPKGLQGEAISLPARVVQVAHDVEMFDRLDGRDAALEAVRQRSGTGYDPSVARIFIEDAADVMAEVPSGTAWEAVLAAEPDPAVSFSESHLDAVADAMADFVDLKSPYLHGHSSGVGGLVDGAARALSSSDAERATIRRAALMHDLGRAGIPNGIWQRRGPLAAAEWERVRLHAYLTERILSRSSALASLASVGAAHHERLDGTGYHRGSGGAQLSIGARIVAAADVYQAMTQERAHRPACSPDAAARELQDQVSAGRLDRQAVNGVLEAAGQRRLASRGAWPAGLSDREVEVLRLLCGGATNRKMAARLHLSEKTVGHHVEHIYNKIGRSTRAGAALFAMENDLIG